jgi:hypothetical protein
LLDQEHSPLRKQEQWPEQYQFWGLLRAKEREPQEGDPQAGASARRDGEALKIGQGDPRT